MNRQLRLIVYKKKYICDDVVVSPKSIVHLNNTVTINNNTVEKNECNEVFKTCDSAQQQKKHLFVSLRKKGFNAYLISVYMQTLSRSNVYRKLAVNALVHCFEAKFGNLDLINSVILIQLRTPRFQFIDYGWNERLTQMAREKEEIDHAMSWLSTLGGAFSALGDKFDHCAKMAGKISIEQFKLSMRLGDPQLLARCELYAALSLLQLGHFKISRNMVKKIYKFAVSDKDVRLQRMCQGVWAKLNYCYHQRKQGV